MPRQELLSPFSGGTAAWCCLPLASSPIISNTFRFLACLSADQLQFLRWLLLLVSSKLWCRLYTRLQACSTWCFSCIVLLAGSIPLWILIFRGHDLRGYSYHNQKPGDSDEAPIQILDGRLIDSTSTLEPAQAKLTVNEEDPLLPLYSILSRFYRSRKFAHFHTQNIRTWRQQTILLPPRHHILKVHCFLLCGLNWMDVE